MPRAVGEVTHALMVAAACMCQETGYTWRDLAAAAQVGWDDARRACDNLHRAGRLVVIGSHKPPHCNRWMRLYALPAPAVVPVCELTAVMAAWVPPLAAEGAGHGA